MNQLVIKTRQGFDGGAPFEFGPPTPEFVAQTDPATQLRAIARAMTQSPEDADSFTVKFLLALADSISLEQR